MIRALAFAAVLLAIAASGALAAPTTITDGKFGQPGAERPIPADHAPGRVSGSLPAGWTDNSEWAKAYVSYTDAAEAGRSFTHVAVSRIDEGWAQMALDLPAVKEPCLMRLACTLRSTAGSSMQIGVRLRGAPYTFLWQTTIPVRRDWDTYSYEFPLEPRAQPVGLFVVFPGVGQIDIENLRLVQLSLDDLRAEIRAKHPDGGPPNLLRCSRFPLGIQSGWSLTAILGRRRRRHRPRPVRPRPEQRARAVRPRPAAVASLRRAVLRARADGPPHGQPLRARGRHADRRRHGGRPPAGRGASGAEARAGLAAHRRVLRPGADWARSTACAWRARAMPGLMRCRWPTASRHALTSPR